jgi:preprotein translocase subunit SecD
MFAQDWTRKSTRHCRPPASAWRRLALAVALLVALAACGMRWSPTPEPTEAFAFRITYQAAPGDGATPTPAEMTLARTIVQSRLDATGIAALQVTIQEPDRLVVEAAPAGVIEAVRALAGPTGRLDFVPLGDTEMSSGQMIDLNTFASLFSGAQVARATIGADQTGQRTVDLVLRDEGKRLLADYTRAHVGDSIAIVLDGKVLTTPVIMAAIPNGEVQISLVGTGAGSLVEAQNLITILKSGQNPIPLREIQVEQR